MLYVVTTTAFDGAPVLGVFTEEILALEAIHKYIEDNDKLEPIEPFEGQIGEYLAFNNEDGCYVIFYVESCYPNVPLT